MPPQVQEAAARTDPWARVVREEKVPQEVGGDGFKRKRYAGELPAAPRPAGAQGAGGSQKQQKKDAARPADPKERDALKLRYSQMRLDLKELADMRRQWQDGGHFRRVLRLDREARSKEIISAVKAKIDLWSKKSRDEFSRRCYEAHLLPSVRLPWSDDDSERVLRLWLDMKADIKVRIATGYPEQPDLPHHQQPQQNQQNQQQQVPREAGARHSLPRDGAADGDLQGNGAGLQQQQQQQRQQRQQASREDPAGLQRQQQQQQQPDGSFVAGEVRRHSPPAPQPSTKVPAARGGGGGGGGRDITRRGRSPLDDPLPAHAHIAQQQQHHLAQQQRQRQVQLQQQQQQQQQQPPQLSASCCSVSSNPGSSPVLPPGAVAGVFVGIPITAVPAVEVARILSWPELHIWNEAYSGNVEGLKTLLKANPEAVDTLGYLKTKPTAEVSEAQRLGLRKVKPTGGRTVFAVLPAPPGDESRATPLHYAIAGGQLDCAKLLLKRGASLSACCQQGSSAFHVASRPDRPTLVALLHRENEKRKAGQQGAGAFKRLANMLMP
ncbi:hypothetical protein DIPPA_34310 [Diplonema papillatum]|nr:hypothetical protein DIPPA_34310 [Diplonema papillatum]